MLCAGIGVGPQISVEEYGWLMDNAVLVSPEDRADYVTRVVQFLRTNHSQPIPDVERYNEGDRVEHWLGIPRNNFQIGDLYGIELKSLNFNASYLRFSSCAILTRARERLLRIGRGRTPNERIHYQPIQNYVYFAGHQERIDQPISDPSATQPPFITFNGEHLYCNQESSWGRLRLRLLGDAISIGVRRDNSERWANCSDTVDLQDYFSKFQNGTIVVFRHRRTGHRPRLLHTEVILGLNSEYLIDLVQRGHIYMEIRLQRPSAPRNPGEAWQISRTGLNEIIYDEDLVDEDRTCDWACDPSIFN